MTEKREYQRTSPKETALLNFAYHFAADLDVLPLEKLRRQHPPLKHDAVVKDISVEGMCFHSLKKLKRGERLNLEIYIPGGDKPIHMEGQVKWSKAVLLKKRNKNSGYDTGVKLTTIENRAVHDSVHFDEAYHVYWSDVLESIIGQFKSIQQKRRNR